MGTRSRKLKRITAVMLSVKEGECYAETYIKQWLESYMLSN